MFRKTFCLLTTLLTVLLLNISTVSAFEVTVDNLVGISSGTAFTTTPLPSTVKANSSYVPLFRINISSNYFSGELYTLKAVTVTIRNVSNFDPAQDLYPISQGGIVLVADSGNGSTLSTSTNTWDGYSLENSVNSNIYPTSWTGSTPWTICFNPVTPPPVDTANRSYTYYVCIKTTSTISHDDKLRAEINSTGEIKLDIYNGNPPNDHVYVEPTTSAGTTLTADTQSPDFKISYTPNPQTGTTLTVNNVSSHGYNIFSTTDISVTANNIMSIKVNVMGNSSTDLTNGVYNLSNLFTLDTSNIDGNASKTLAATAGLSSGGYTEYTLTYTITTSTTNAPTTPQQIKVKVRDAAGNESAWDESFYVYMDRTKPTIVTITAPSANEWIGESLPYLSWQPATDENLERYMLIVSTDSDLSDVWTNTTGNGYRTLNNVLMTNWADSSNWTNYFPLSSESVIYYWDVLAKDKAGNYSTFRAGREFMFDKTAPHIYNELPNGTTTNNQPLIKVDIDDAGNGINMSGIDFSSITLTLDGQILQFSTVTINSSTTTIIYIPISPLADGAYTAKLWVKDKVGVSSKKTWSFTVDTTKPVVLDTDNDGYSNYNEIWYATDPNNSSSKPSSSADFSPKQSEIVGTTFVSGGQKINLRVDDPYSLIGIDTQTTKNSIIINHLTRGITENYYTSYVIINTSATTYGLQLVRALSNNGVDDGIISVTCTPKDNIGNTGDTATRYFIYDTISPRISTVSVPSTGDTISMSTFTIEVNDTYGASSDASAVQLTFWNDTNSPYNMSLIEGTTNRYTVTINSLGSAKTWNYYFTAKDRVGNTSYYPPNANSSSSYAIPFIVTDKSAPQVAVYQIETLLGYTLA